MTTLDTKLRRQADVELNYIDNILARRSALDDIPNRVDKIQHAINTAAKHDQLQMRVEELERALKHMLEFADRTGTGNAKQIENARAALQQETSNSFSTGYMTAISDRRLDASRAAEAMRERAARDAQATNSTLGETITDRIRALPLEEKDGE